MEEGRTQEGTIGTTTKIEVENFSILRGEIKYPFWCGELFGYIEGTPFSVEFDPRWVLDDPNCLEQILGFYHTHPGFPPTPSPRDVQTMKAWVTCLGKPLLCLIEGLGGLKAYWFTDSIYHEQTVRQFGENLFVGALLDVYVID